MENKTPCNLQNNHIQDLQSSGLSEETILANGLYSARAEEAGSILGFPAGPGLAFPYPHSENGNGKPFIRIKPDNPPVIEGKLAKYLSPLNGGNHLYFPHGILERLQAEEPLSLIITEGEKKALKAVQEGFVCIGLSGVWNFKITGEDELLPDFDNFSLQGRKVFICFDSDRTDNPDIRKAEKRLAQLLFNRGAKVFIVKIPKASITNGQEPKKTGLDDYLISQGGSTFEELLQKAQGCSPREREKNQAELLLEMASSCELFHDNEGKAYASFLNGEAVETVEIQKPKFQDWLRKEYFGKKRRIPHVQAVNDAIATLEGKARYEGREEAVFLRVAGKDGAIYIDLGNEKWEAVCISSQGWEIVPKAPVKFRRPNTLREVPRPRKGGSVDILRSYINYANENQFRLIIGFLLAVLNPKPPYPILILLGEMGSAKSTLAKICKRLVDMAQPQIKSFHRSERDLAISAGNGWLLNFDNMPPLDTEDSNSLCKLATGAGFSTRKLYTDDEEFSLELARPIILNGIEDIASKSDLIDRSVILQLPAIPDSKRKREEEMWSKFEEDAPEIFGGLLDALCGILKNKDSVKLPNLPRMADFAVWVTAAEEVLGWKPKSFLTAYEENRQEALRQNLEASPIAQAVLAFLKARKSWAGRISDLHRELKAFMPEDTGQSKAWPKTPSWLSNQLRKIAPLLRNEGLNIELKRTKTGGEAILSCS